MSRKRSLAGAEESKSLAHKAQSKTPNSVQPNVGSQYLEELLSNVKPSAGRKGRN